MRKLQEPNYKLIINTDFYTGNFERELIAYTFGILDEVQMEINYAQEYREVFYSEEDLTINECYDFLNEYLFERYQTVNDWEQMIFYDLCNYIQGKGTTSIEVFFDKVPEQEWMDRINNRISKFFSGAYKEIEDARWQAEWGQDSPLKFPKLLNVVLTKNKDMEG